MIFFHLLYDLVGKNEFNHIIGGFYRTFYATGATTEQFIQFVKRNSKQDLTHFFEEWAYSPVFAKRLNEFESYNELYQFYKVNNQTQCCYREIELRDEKMIRRVTFLIITVLLPSCSFVQTVKVKPYECGPLARGNFGVVFSVIQPSNSQTYFVKGEANDVCPKLLSADCVLGVESSYCANNNSANEYECNSIKIFSIIQYQNGTCF
ncbi:hypothetical protein [Pseudoalteromonas umbrosa]|uniref:hypothetical protein n=1 Tax=Pseudoalteromonas umbrosa TaxID=3048489 RepID=UPI0024C30A25|nr:hypothetical protein [Pseudoalteromonas sp. B95]MDK1286383.1 hypothetical protein [Pseudoalteromonas sp. B95]